MGVLPPFPGGEYYNTAQPLVCKRPPKMPGFSGRLQCGYLASGRRYSLRATGGGRNLEIKEEK